MDDIIKKAAAPKKSGTAAAGAAVAGTAVAGTAAAGIPATNALNGSASPASKKQGTPVKQSTLASNKIQTDDELDMPETLTAADIQHEIAEQAVETVTYTFPPIELLKSVDNDLNAAEAEAEMKTNADTLVDTLKSFGVQTRIVDIHRGPTVTRYELQPSAGVKISKITGLSRARRRWAWKFLTASRILLQFVK